MEELNWLLRNEGARLFTFKTAVALFRCKSKQHHQFCECN